MPTDAKPQHADGLSLQISDAVDALVAEQYVAADMDAGQQRQRFSLIEADDEVRRIVHQQIHVAARQRFGTGHRRNTDVADIDETLRLEQLLG